MTLIKNSNLIPSICKIYFAPMEDVNSISNAPDRFHKFVEFKSGCGWQQIYCTLGFSEFAEKSKDADPGELIEQSLKFVFPGEDDSNMAALDGILGRSVLVKIQFSTGESKLLGDFGNGAKLYQVSQYSSKSSGSQLEFTCTAIYRACWITS